MRAVFQARYGGPEQLEVREIPKPTVRDGEVLVRVHAASLHPDVWHVVSGRPYVLRPMAAGLLRPRNPIPGTDMAGVVEQAGNGVARFRPGDAVFGETASLSWRNGGAFAEYVTVPEAWLAGMPDRVSFEQAASVPTSGFILLLNLRDASELRPGRRVLVNGAGGGVGSLALQLAKSRGAHVTAVDSAGKLGLLRSLGADEVLDYAQEDFVRRGVRYHLIIDVPGTRPLSAFRPALERDGRYVPIGHEGFGASGKRVLGLLPHFLSLLLRARFTPQLRGPRVSPPSRTEAMETLRSLLASGAITPVIDRSYPLEEVRAAMRHMMEDELQGKVILTPLRASPPGTRSATAAAPS